MTRVLELGGTSDSIAIALRLQEEGIPFLLSFTTDYGLDLARESGVKDLRAGNLDAEGMTRLIQEGGFTCLLDATHPFARGASETAMAVAKACQIPYIRFERPQEEEAGALYVETIAEACQAAEECLADRPEGTVYLTVGTRTLDQYLARLPKDKIVARVLPRTESLETCQALGLELGQVEGLMGPFSVETNLALIRENHAACLISKDSGRRGGLEEKVEACREAGIPCIILTRPPLVYPQVTSSVEELVDWLRG